MLGIAVTKKPSDKPQRGEPTPQTEPLPGDDKAWKKLFASLPVLANHPRWKEAVAIEQRLQSQLRTFTEQNNNSEAASVVAQPPVLSELQRQIEAWAAGDDDSFKPSIAPLTVGPAELKRACETSLSAHQHRTYLLRYEVQAELSPAWEKLRRVARQRLARAILETKAAFDEEMRIANAEQTADIADGNLYLYRATLNWSSCARLQAALRGFRSAEDFQRDNADLLNA